MAKKKSQQKSPPAAAAETQLLGAVDIGTNSIRLSIGQVTPDGRIVNLERAQQTVRLGQDSFRGSHRIEPATIRAAVSVLRDFKRRLDFYNVRHIWTVGTSVLRESVNAEVFLDRILMATGLDVDVIDSTLEGRLIVSAVRSVMDSRPPSLGARTLITEVGGGSTILTVLDHGEIETSQSLTLGSVRLQEVLGTSGLPPQESAELISNEVSSTLSTLESVVPLGDVRTVFAVGADARFAASQIGTPLKNPAFTLLSRKKFVQLVDAVRQSSVEEIVSAYDIPYNDAETLVPALMIYRHLFDLTGAKQIYVASVSMRDGLLLELARRSTGRQDESFGKEVIQSAAAVAEKYHVNLRHVSRVAACAVTLFDALHDEHRLGSRYRVILEVAALLHEIGMYVSTRAYHKHTYYLIANSQIFGLTRSELSLVANVARYHRHSAPKPTHSEYMGLSRENRIVVNKLAAILRIAKALEVSDIRSIESLKYEISQDAFIIKVPGLQDGSLRKRSLELRSDLFEDVFGLKLEFMQAK